MENQCQIVAIVYYNFTNMTLKLNKEKPKRTPSRHMIIELSEAKGKKKLQQSNIRKQNMYLPNIFSFLTSRNLFFKSFVL